jgi:Photosynthesis system II assembly factor YCF48/Putative zinc-finger
MGSDFTNRLRKNLEHPAPAEHPAPDALNAYVEHALTRGEERRVTQHLSVCAECRDVVFLASEAAQSEASQPVVLPTVRKTVRWWTWALPVTAVLVVAAVVLVRPNLTGTKQYAQMAEPPRNSEAHPTQDKLAPQREDTTLAVPAAPAAAAKQKAHPVEPVAAPPPAPTHEAPNNTFAKDLSSARPAASSITGRNVAPMLPPPSEAVSVQAGNAPAAQAPAAQTGTNQTDELTAKSGSRDQRVEVTAEATSLQTEPDAKPKAARAESKPLSGNAVGYSAGTIVKKSDNASAWRVTPDGRLLHSVLGNWQQLLPDVHAHFNVVAVLGSNVWAGGNALALYHSPDDGQTWERQTLPHASGDDIAQIRFTSPREGVLTTKRSAAFITHDGGNMWTADQETSRP